MFLASGQGGRQSCRSLTDQYLNNVQSLTSLTFIRERERSERSSFHTNEQFRLLSSRRHVMNADATVIIS